MQGITPVGAAPVAGVDVIGEHGNPEDGVSPPDKPPKGDGSPMKVVPYASHGIAIVFGFHTTRVNYGGGQDSVDDLYNWVDLEYTDHYYSDVQSSTAYVYTQTVGASTIQSFNPSRTLIADSSGIGREALYGLESGSSGVYFEAGDRRLQVKPDKVQDVVDHLAKADPAGAVAFAQNVLLSNSAPVTIVAFETAALVSDSNGQMYAITVSDLMRELGYSAEMNSRYDGGGTKTVTYKTGATQECYFASIMGAETNVSSKPAFTGGTERSKMLASAFKMLTGYSIYGSKEAGSYVGAAALTAEGNAAGGFAGCYGTALGFSDTPGERKYALYGSFEWDLNAESIPTNIRGYMEDGSAIVPAKSQVVKDFKLGYIDLQTPFWTNWDEYLKKYPQNVTLTLTVYGSSKGNGGSNFTMDRSLLLGGMKSSNGEGVERSYEVTLSPTQLVDYMKNGSEGRLNIFGGKPYYQSKINASMFQGMVSGSFACKLTAKINSGTLAGTVDFTNNQVHYYKYTFESDENRTYDLVQKKVEGWSQLKTNAIAQAQFEARNGTPTTEDMFISMGGSEYVVNMQYRYCVDDYIRKYTLNTEKAYPNFMYYKVGDGGYSADAEVSRATTDSELSNLQACDPDYDSRNNKNMAWEIDGTLVNQINDAYDSKALQFKNEVVKIFNSIDENLTNSSIAGVYSDTDYDVIVKRGLLSVNEASWSIEGIDTAVVGYDAEKVKETKDKLKALSASLVVLKDYSKNGNGSRGTRTFYDTVQSKLNDISGNYKLPLNITFMSLRDDALDYDSNMDGTVTVKFEFKLDNNGTYSYSTDNYYDYAKWYCETKACTIGAEHSEDTTLTDSVGPVILSAKSKEITLTAVDKTEDHGHLDTCIVECKCTPAPVPAHTKDTCPNWCKEEHICSFTECPEIPGPNHKHVKKSYVNSSPTSIYDEVLGTVWESTDDCKFPHVDTHVYKAGIQAGISINYVDDKISNSIKNLSYSSTMSQVFEDVKYLDIVDCHVWRLAGGTALSKGGLDGLMVSYKEPGINIEPIIEMSCIAKGLKFYNIVHSADSLGVWTNSIKLADGTSESNAWSKKPGILDKDTNTVKGNDFYNDSLSKDNRLANSLNVNSDAVTNLVGGYLGGKDHGLKIAGTDDTVTLTYDIAEQGGKSHWSFYGFLKQAVALALYEDEDPLHAVRNYLAVQSDYLTLDTGQTLVGFHYATKDYDPGETANAKLVKAGLRQAILNTDKNDARSVLVNYVKKTGKYWTKQDNVDATGDDKTINTGTNGLNNTNVASTDPMPKNGCVVSTDDSPTTALKALIRYADGDTDVGTNKTFVKLSVHPEYAKYTKEYINETGSATNLTNFNVEGKKPELPPEFMPKVGYIGAQDSVGTDQHLYVPSSGGATSYNSGATLVEGGYNGVSFELYGKSSSVLIITQSSPESDVVSASDKSLDVQNKIYEWGGFFPMYMGLNVIRWKPNGTYGGYPTALVYDEVLHHSEASGGGINSKEAETVSALMDANQFSAYVSNIIADFTPNNTWGAITDEDPTNNTRGSGLITCVGYGGADDSYTNSVNIFNPSTAESVIINPASDMLPDAKNKMNGKGYTPRDQRVSTVSVATNNEPYISYEEIKPSTVDESKVKVEYTLKPTTKYANGSTEAYTMDDYVLLNDTKALVGPISTSQQFLVKEPGNYTVSIFDRNDMELSFDMDLFLNDVLTTDGESVYIQRAIDINPTLTYDNLANSVSQYYKDKASAEKENHRVSEMKAIIDVAENYAKINNALNQNINTLLDIAYMQLVIPKDEDTTSDGEMVELYNEKGIVDNEAINAEQERLKKIYEETCADVTKAYKFYNDCIAKLVSSGLLIDGVLVRNHSEYPEDVSKVIERVNVYVNALNEYSRLLTKCVTKCELEDNITINKEPISVVVKEYPDTSNDYKGKDKFKVEAGSTMILDLSTVSMSKGSVLKVRLPFADNYLNPVELTVNTQGSVNVHPTKEGNTSVWYIEAEDDLRLGTLVFNIRQEAWICESKEPYVAFEKVWLFEAYPDATGSLSLSSTLDHDIIKRTQHLRSYNKYLFNAETTLDIEDRSGLLSGHIYALRETIPTMVLKGESEMNPHRVYNANWRYYVVGWTTQDGDYIESPTDPKLYNASTVLRWPAEVSGTITVGDLDEQACLVMYGGKVYLTTKEAGYSVVTNANGESVVERRILQTGVIVDSYDSWTLGFIPDSKVYVEDTKLANNVTGITYPIPHNFDAKTTERNESYYNYNVEFFFTCESSSMDEPLFDTSMSRNRTHRFDQLDDVTVSGNTLSNSEMDWEKEEKLVPNIRFIDGLEVHVDQSAEYLSLDDEFTIYFDNVGNFTGNSALQDAGATGGGELGYGWNANGPSKLGDDVDKGVEAWYGGTTPDGKPNVPGAYSSNTETTAWIYAKFVKFPSTDIYVFAKKGSDGNYYYNPTLPAFNADGTANKPILIRKNTPVYLGTYLGEHNDEADNTGGFLDYGAPSITEDPEGKPYTYHFWLPLSAGESNNGFAVEFYSVNINSEQLGGSNKAGHASLSDDVGINASKDNNNSSSITNDDQAAVNRRLTSVVGRIGALTIVDTGDPRLSDTFKVTDVTDSSDSNYLIYPLVRKIKEYTNTFTPINKNGKVTGYQAGLGSQRGIVLDPFDVRGRIATGWAKTLVDNNSDDTSKFDYYNTYSANSYDTYGTQAHKHFLQKWNIKTSDKKEGSVQLGALLPLKPNFNKHETFKTEPLKVGYELYLSLETIGSYVSRGMYLPVETGDNSDGNNSEIPADVEPSNGNNDYGDRKVQVRPYYFAVDATTADGDPYDGAVDVYMRQGDTYILVNYGCSATNAGEEEGANANHKITDIVDLMNRNTSPYYIETNTGEFKNKTFELDENMQRRMVTSDEAEVTASVMTNFANLRSLLTRIDKSTGSVGGDELEIRYSYGNTQMLFLRDRNMTFVGGPTVALDWNNKSSSEQQWIETYKNGQKYYFGLGLPSSSVFVPHGQTLNMSNVLKKGYIVNAIDVIAAGDVWTLHYESEVSKLKINVGDKTYRQDEWNKYWKKLPWLVPVTYYDLSETTLMDVDTQGSH